MHGAVSFFSLGSILTAYFTRGENPSHSAPPKISSIAITQIQEVNDRPLSYTEALIEKGSLTVPMRDRILGGWHARQFPNEPFPDMSEKERNDIFKKIITMFYQRTLKIVDPLPTNDIDLEPLTPLLEKASEYI